MSGAGDGDGDEFETFTSFQAYYPQVSCDSLREYGNWGTGVARSARGDEEEY